MRSFALSIGGALAALGLVLVVRAAAYLPGGAESSEPQLVFAGTTFLLAFAVLPLLAGSALLASGLNGRRRWWAASPLLVALVVLVVYGAPTLVEVCQRPGGACG